MAGFNDLQGMLQATAILLIPGVTCGVVLASWAAPDRERVMRALGLTLVIGLAYFLLGLYYSSLGWPILQIVVPVGCLWAGIFIGWPRLHQIFSVSLLFVTLVLLSWYAVLVQSRYVGRPDWIGQEQVPLEQSLGSMRRALLRDGGADEMVYPSGWLAESELMGLYDRSLAGVVLSGTVERSAPLWHTWLTALHARIVARREVYYPGGRLSEGVPKMEWRDRPNRE
ncbi:MAG: hypothetical protein HYY16_05720 [Planctomycetes bacterium]|nr:hypothetical protein [Planctomycetota bacterium]